MSTYKPLSDFAQEELVIGREALQQKYLHLYPKYKGLQKYNLGLVQKSYTTNTLAFCEQLSQFLESKQPNCQVIYGQEVEQFVMHDYIDRKHLVKGVRLSG